MAARPKAIIVGAGPGGLTAALALEHAGIDAYVFERAAGRGEAGSCFTLWPNALRAYDRLGLGDAVRELGDPLDGIEMRSSRGTELFHVDRATMLERFGDSGVAVERAELVALLERHLDPSRLCYGVRCTDFEQRDADVTAFFDDGSCTSAALLIGADGLRSTIRAALFGERSLRFRGSTVWRGVARLPLRRRSGVTLLGRGAQFGMFPMADDRVYWFASANAVEGEREAAGGRKAELTARFANWHDGVLDAIAHSADASILRNDIYDMDPLACLSSGRVTLLGDAAHPAAPDLGQGACQAIEDALVLVDALRRSTGVAAALCDYTARRAGRTGDLTLQARRLSVLGTWADPVACWVRDRALGLIPEFVRLRHLASVFAFDP